MPTKNNSNPAKTPIFPRFMPKATEVVYKYYEGGFAVKHRKDGFKASLSEVLLGYKSCVAFLG